MPRLLFRACSSLAILALASGQATAQSCLCGTAADELVVERFGLTREWVVQVPFDSAAWRLEHVVVGEKLVVAQGGDGTVAAIATVSSPGGPRRGTVAWSQRIEGSTVSPEAAGIGETAVAVARGKQLTTLDARTGSVLWQRPLRTVASAAAVPAGGWVYMPLDAGGIVRFPEDPWAADRATAPAAENGGATEAAETGPRPGETREPVELSSDGEVDFPPVPFEGGILWVTAGGRIRALVRGSNGSERLEFDLGSPPSGSPVIRGGDVFVATRAGDLARLARSPRGLTANTGVMKDKDAADVAFQGWHTILPATPEGSPVVSPEAVVVSLGPDGMAAFATDTGDPLWQISTMGRPLAIIDGRVWCLEETGFLVARDLATGGRRGRLCLGCFTLPVTNPTGDRLVLASPGGLVVSLAPRRTIAAQPPVPQPPVADENGAAAPAEGAGDGEAL
jgi:outer membrane protein assembly factor BamB